MLTPKSLYVLSLLCRSQNAKGSDIFVSYDNMCFYQVSDAGTYRSDVPFSKFKYPEAEMITILESLEQEGMIKRIHPDFKYLRITHTGAEFFQTKFLSAALALLLSVLIPAAVSYATCSFTYYIETGSRLWPAVLEWFRSTL